MKTFGTVADVAEMSGKSTNSVIRYSDDGKIDCLTTDKGHRLFIDPKESARQLVQAMGKVKKKKDDKLRKTKESTKGVILDLENKLDEINSKLDVLLDIVREDDDLEEEQLDLFDENGDEDDESLDDSSNNNAPDNGLQGFVQ